MVFKKKLHRYRPGPEPTIEVQTNRTRTKPIACDPRSIEHGVRQLLADKVTGNLAGIWLLVPELLRLGAWDLVRGWTKQKPEQVNPRLALQLIHEAALCRTGLRHRRTLNQRIFELANGLPFLATDGAVHDLLGARTVADSLCLQVALGKLRRASGDFRGRVLAVDPHRVPSFSKRHMHSTGKMKGNDLPRWLRRSLCSTSTLANPSVSPRAPRHAELQPRPGNCSN